MRAYLRQAVIADCCCALVPGWLALGMPKPVRESAGGLPVSRPAVSQHLRLLLDICIVSQERVGRENRYQLHPEQLDEVRHWIGQLDAMWGSALAGLRHHLERNRDQGQHCRL